MRRLLGELEAIREVINVFPGKRRQKAASQQTVLTKTSEVQDRLMHVLGLARTENDSLGNRRVRATALQITRYENGQQ